MLERYACHWNTFHFRIGYAFLRLLKNVDLNRHINIFFLKTINFIHLTRNKKLNFSYLLSILTLSFIALKLYYLKLRLISFCLIEADINE